MWAFGFVGCILFPLTSGPPGADLRPRQFEEVPVLRKNPLLQRPRRVQQLLRLDDAVAAILTQRAGHLWVTLHIPWHDAMYTRYVIPYCSNNKEKPPRHPRTARPQSNNQIQSWCHVPFYASQIVDNYGLITGGPAPRRAVCDAAAGTLGQASSALLPGVHWMVSGSLSPQNIRI